MRVHVVDDADPATTQSAIDTAKAERIALDEDDALALHDTLSKKRSSHKVDGKKVWDAWSWIRHQALLAARHVSEQADRRQGREVSGGTSDNLITRSTP